MRQLSSKAAVWRWVWCLLTVAFLLRSLIPAGYMPDLAAAKEGRLQFVICSGHSAASLEAASETGQHGDDAHGQQGHHLHDQHGATDGLPALPGDGKQDGLADIPCIFAGTTAAITLPASTADAVEFIGHPERVRFKFEPLILQPYDVGPQLGARAPPTSIVA